MAYLNFILLGKIIKQIEHGLIEENLVGKQKSYTTVKAMQKEMNTESQTAFIGTSCLFTLCHREDNAIAPSLENAYAILIREEQQIH